MPSWRSASPSTRGAEPVTRVGRRWLLALVLGPLCLVAGAAPAPTAATLWRALAWFDGQWSGTERGPEGDGDALRCQVRAMDGMRLVLRRVNHASAADHLESGTHDDWQLISFDAAHDGMQLHAFTDSGLVNAFTVDMSVSRGDYYVFEAPTLANAPARLRGQLTLRVIGHDSFEETLAMGPEGAAPAPVRQTLWKRLAGADPGACAPVMPAPPEPAIP